MDLHSSHRHFKISMTHIGDGGDLLKVPPQIRTEGAGNKIFHIALNHVMNYDALDLSLEENFL